MRALTFVVAFIVFFAGCMESIEYVCYDGDIVADKSECPPIRMGGGAKNIPDSPDPPVADSLDPTMPADTTGPTGPPGDPKEVVFGPMTAPGEPSPPDCGLSTLGAEGNLMKMSEEEMDADKNLACFGKALLDSCATSMIVVRDDKGDMQIDSRVMDDGRCLLHFTSQGKYADCPVDLEAIKAKGDANVDMNEHPGGFASLTFILASFDMLDKETECTGTLIDHIRSGGS